MSLDSRTIATGIAALSVTSPTTGKKIVIKDIDGIPQQVQARDCPIMFPHPNNWMQGGNGGTGNTEGADTFGAASKRYWMFARTYQYVYLHAMAGTDRGIYVHYKPAGANLDAIQTALTTLDLASVDVLSMTALNFGLIEDPVSGQFYGCIIDVKLMERLNP